MQVELPRLDGRIGKVILILYRVMAAVTALYVALDLPLEAVDLFRNSPAVSHYGFTVQRGARGALPVTGLYPSAAKAGLHLGDLVVGVNDVRFTKRATRFDLGAKFADLEDKPAAVTLIGPQGTTRTVVLKPQSRGLGLIHLFYGMPIWAFGVVQLILLAIPMLVLLGASFLLYKRRPSDPEAMLLAFSFLALTYATSNGSWPFLYAHVPGLWSDMTGQIGVATLCIAVAGVPDGRFSSLWGLLTLVFAGIYGLAGIWIASLQFQNPILTVSGTLPEYAAILFAVLALVARFRKSADIERQQIKWVLIGAVVTLLAALFPVALGGAGLGADLPPWAAQFVQIACFDIFHIAAPAGMLVSVLAYRLYDSEAAVARSAAYAALSVAVVGVFAASESVVQSFGQKMVSSQLGSFSGTLAAVFAAMMISPMHARIKRLAERSLRKDLFRMREGLPPLVGDLRETTHLRQIADVVLDRVRSGVRPTAAAIVMADGPLVSDADVDITAWQALHAPLKADALVFDKADPVFPTRVSLSADGIGQVGWLLLGPRPDGSLYGKDERKALVEIADPIARALAIAATREARSAQHENDNRALRARIDEVEAALARFVGREQATGIKP